MITCAKSTSKPFATAIVFGLGEIMFPALPPPIISKSIKDLLIPTFLATDNAIGSTLITETAINTPTEVVYEQSAEKDPI